MICNVTARPEITIAVNMNHLDDFIRLKCSADLIQEYPNVKEITESVGVFKAVLKFHEFKDYSKFGDKNVTCVVPGDGRNPRTGLIAAFRTRWNVYSIDPIMKEKYIDNFHIGFPKRPVKNLQCVKGKIEEFKLDNLDECVILLTHSHVKIEDVINAVGAKKYYIVALPCCVPQKQFQFNGQTIKPIKTYTDLGILTPKNKVHLFKLER